MRLGNFWGLPAPMILIIFDGHYDLLMKYVCALNTESSSFLLEDIQKEFLALQRVCDSAVYTTPEIESILDDLIAGSAFVKDGIITYGNGTEDTSLFGRLVTELSVEVLKKVISNAEKGKCVKVPADLRERVQAACESKDFVVEDWKSIVREVVRELPGSTVLDVSEVVESFHLKKTAPKRFYFGQQVTEMTAELQNVWNFYSKREPVIREVLNRISFGYTEEEETFGIPFFNLIHRNPESLRYQVDAVFERAKSRQTARFLPECIEECRCQIDKFKECLKKYVVLEGVTNSSVSQIQNRDKLYSILKTARVETGGLFDDLMRNGYLKLENFQEDTMEMLVQIADLIFDFQDEGFNGLWGSSDDVCTKSIGIGVCGLNTESTKLFEEAVKQTIVSERGKIERPGETLKALEFVLNDVDALLETLVPVGEVIQYE